MGKDFNVTVIKKDKTKEKWSRKKLMNAINKAGIRARSYVYSDDIVLSQAERSLLYNLIEKKVASLNSSEVTTEILHSFIIEALDTVAPDIAKVYKDYHNFRIAEAKEYESVMGSIDDLTNNGNLDNANSDAMFVATQNNLAACFIEKSRFRNYFLTGEEIKAIKDGFIYVHDEDHRMLYPFNCCLFLAEILLKTGFRVNGVDYVEPKTISRALSELGDIFLSASAAQYGGFTISRIENLISYFCKKTFEKLYPEKLKNKIDFMKDFLGRDLTEEEISNVETFIKKEVEDTILDDIKQGYQGLEYKLNTVASSRGDYPFTTITLGNTLYGDYWAEKACEIILEVRKNGQGVKGKKKPVAFPKIIFLYDETLHGEGMPYEALFDKAIDCSCVTMYPDYISLTGYGSTADIYTRYNGIERIYGEDEYDVIGAKIKEGYKDGRLVPLDDPRRKKEKYSHEHPETAISSMGCRSFLSPWYAHNDKNIKKLIPSIESLDKEKYEILPKTKFGFVRYKNKETGYIYTTDVKDHMYPIYEEEVPIYEGRQNNGVITLNLPLIYQYSKENNLDFFDKLAYYMEMIRKLHLRSIEFNSKKKASINPYAFMYGGLIDSDGKPTHKKPNEKIGSILSCGTVSFGVTALNELQLLHNGQTIRKAMEEKKKLIKKYGRNSDKVINPFCEETVDFILSRIARYKDEDNVLHSLYATPAEKLSGTQSEQFKKMFPNVKVKGFTNHSWVSNSFHIHVSEDITVFDKQDLEFDFFHKFTGGRIQYFRIPLKTNKQAVKDSVRRGMRLGYYQGINIDLSFCDDCGTSFDSENISICKCPKCGSKKITTMNRLCGYLGFTRRGEFYEEDDKGNVINNGNRINLPMVDNIKARKCM